ncbi:MAG: transglutaminase domain-containing protein [Pirellulaceae bacterium]|nr:transglutaminase domain-containing protein [Pirellulaceae bacterium]
MSTTQYLYGQEEKKSLKFIPQDEQTWKLGVEVEAQGGIMEGVVATIPMPIDWPEQKITIIKEDTSRGVRKITFRKMVGAHQIVVSVPRINAGQVARAVVTIKVEKSFIEESDQPTEDWSIPQKLTRQEKTYLKASPYIETKHPTIKKLAKELKAKGENETDWKKVELIFDWVRENLEYELDPVIRSPLEALKKGKGDCEEMTSLFVAICRVNKIPARSVWIPGHTYPEFLLQDKEGNKVWIPCQIAGEGHDFGRMPERLPILQKGDNFKVRGLRSPQRYVTQRLTATNATTTPIVRWIMEEVQ